MIRFMVQTNMFRPRCKDKSAVGVDDTVHGPD